MCVIVGDRECSPQTETVAVECVKVARLMCPVCVSVAQLLLS